MQCANCFQDIANAICPHCSYDNSSGNGPLALPAGLVLAGQYSLGRVLGKPGGFGITYLGWDIRLQKKVAIKEFLPRDYAGRDNDNQAVACYSLEDREAFQLGLDHFLQEARTLAKFSHANIVGVKSFFEENNTAYLVMEYYEGMSLQEYVTQKGGCLSESETIAIMMPILDGLREVHRQGFLHRDIKPQNIYLAANGRPILLDFGAARQALGNRSKNLSVLLTGGFSPYEQYHAKGKQGAWTDIYACAATMYYLVTGQVPQDALERITADEIIPLRQINPLISPQFEMAVLKGMAVNAVNRPQTIEEFQQYLQGNTVMNQEPIMPTIAKMPGSFPPVNTASPQTPVYQVPPSGYAQPGYSQSGYQQTGYSQQMGYPAPNQQTQPSSGGSGKYIFMSVIGTLLAVALLYGGYTMLNGSSTAKTNMVATQTTDSAQQTQTASETTTSANSAPLPPVERLIEEAEAIKTACDFYNLFSRRLYRLAYYYFSENWKSQITYEGWVSGFNNTLSNQLLWIDVPVGAANETNATAKFRLKSRDRDHNRIMVQIFEGEWHLVKENGRWMLDDASVKKVNSYYE